MLRLQLLLCFIALASSSRLIRRELEVTAAATSGLNVVYDETKLTCSNADQKISQPCNGGQGTGCSYDACMQHCFAEEECNFFFHITSTSGCILYNSCEETRTPAYAGTTVEIVLLNTIYSETTLTCFNGEQKISQPCNGGEGTGCSYDACQQHCFDESECNFFFHIISTSGCILYNSCEETRTAAYAGNTVEITSRFSHAPTAQPSGSPSLSTPSAFPTAAPTFAEQGLNVVYYETKLTCSNGDQKISQPCNGGEGTGCTYDACMQHCFDEDECNFFFHITSTSGCILYNSCEETRTPAYAGTTVEIIELNVVYHQTKTTCFNGDQKISQPCNGGEGTGCSYDACQQHCFDESECNFFFHITSTSGCILYNSCSETRTAAYTGTTVEITRPTAVSTQAPTSLNVIYYETKLTCSNGDQKISQPCNGGKGTGCSYDACMQHCFDEDECDFFFHITSTSGCILYNSCADTRTPAYSGTTVEITRN